MFVDVLDRLNFIDRIAGLASMMRYGRGRQIRIRHAKPDKDGHQPKDRTGNYYASVLAQYKIPVYYRRATSKELIFNVPAGQWQWAVDLLRIAGADVQHAYRPWAAKQAGKLPQPWEKRR